MKQRPVASAWGRRGIQTRVMLLVGTGMLAAMLIFGWATWTYSGALRQQLLDERQVLARTVAERVDDNVAADMEALQGVASALRVDLTSANQEPERAALGEAYLRARLFARVFLLDRAGALLAQEPASAAGLPDISPPPAEVQKAMTTGRPVVSGLLADGAGRRVIYALVPVRDWLGQVTGIAGGAIDPAVPRLSALLGPVRLGDTGSADLLDATGTVLATTMPARLFLRTDCRAAAAAAIERREVETVTCRNCVHPGGRADEVAVIVPLTNAPWAVVIRQDTQEAFAASLSMQQTIFVLGPALIALALLFAWGAARSVRQPLAVLTRSAEEIAGGELSHPIPDLPDDEVGRLGRSLERMRAALERSLEDIERANQVLEKRVEERTHELRVLYRELQEREEWRGQLLRKVISAQEDERKRIARELHDETSQTLTALGMKLETALGAYPSDLARERLQEARQLTTRTVEELHRLMRDLRPSVLDDLGLWSAIRWSAERNLEPLGIAVRCEFSGVERRLPPEWETALFRVVQEAINNIARHGHAETVLIQVALRDEPPAAGDDRRAGLQPGPPAADAEVESPRRAGPEPGRSLLAIEIEDDGVGFDPATLPPPGSSQRGLGLMGMRERVELLGGRLDIDAAPGQGVRIALSVPVPEAPHA